MSYGRYDTYDSYGNGNTMNRSYDPLDDTNATGFGSPGAHEMASFGQTSTTSIIQECANIVNGVREIENNMRTLASLQKRSLDDADTSAQSESKRNVDLLTQSIMDQYRGLADRFRQIRRNPESNQPRNQDQVGRAERALQNAIKDFQIQEAGFRQEMESQMGRQYRIVRPNATDAEVREAISDGGNNPVYQQALMHGDRTGKANRVLSAVKDRHEEMLVIERKLEELLNLLTDMEEMLKEQEVTVMAIDTHANDAVTHLDDANKQLDVTITTTRSTRKKKWICLGICVAIIIIIVVAVVAYIMVNRAANGGSGNNNNNDNANNNNNNNNGENGGNEANTGNSGNTGGQKRSLFQRNVLDDLHMNNARVIEIATEHPAARDIGPSTRLSRRRRNRTRGVEAAPEREVNAVTGKRFAVDWEGADTTV